MTYARLRQIAAFRGRAALDCGEQLIERSFEVRRGLAHPHPSLQRDDVEHALELGVRFLKRRQGADGTWKGFLLPPGAATSWLTAHVAFVVEAVPALETRADRPRFNWSRPAPTTAAGATTAMSESTATAPRRRYSYCAASIEVSPSFWSTHCYARSCRAGGLPRTPQATAASAVGSAPTKT